MKLSRLFSTRRSTASRPLRNCIEPLESRIAPATLVSPTTVSFQDKNGDLATVTISKGLFTHANVNQIFQFNTGAVNGNNTVAQQLETLTLWKLGPAARGINVTISATPVNNSPGIVNVGFIDSSGMDLGAVTVQGDLGRMNAGDFTFSKLGLVSLTVDSMGALGTTTQAPGGSLTTNLCGPIGSITINGNFDGAIGIGGNRTGQFGTLSSLIVGGSIIGGSTPFSGSVRTQSGIGSIVVDGNITGGSAANTGLIGTAGPIVSVNVEGSITGGGGEFSGAVLATGNITYAHIYGNLTGGGGENSGQVGTAGNLGTALVDGSIMGGAGHLSGTLLATGSITSATIGNAIIGGAGLSSGQVGAGGNIMTITVGTPPASPAIAHALPAVVPSFQGIEGGSGAYSGAIIALGNLGTVTVYGGISGYLASNTVFEGGPVGPHSGTISAVGDIQSVHVTGTVDYGNILSTGPNGIGPVTIDGGLIDNSIIHASASIGDVSVNASTLLSNSNPGIANSSILADHGNIKSITADGYSDSFGQAISGATITAGGYIGPITATSQAGTVIDSSTFDGATGIGAITVVSGTPPVQEFLQGPLPLAIGGTNDGISNSHFTTNGAIGNISVTTYGGRLAGENAGIGSSTFSAGASIGTITVTNNDTGPNGFEYGIANTSFTAGLGGAGGVGNINVQLTDTLISGNSDIIYKTTVSATGSLGNITVGSLDQDDFSQLANAIAKGIIDSTFRTHGSIGNITAIVDDPNSPGIVGTTFSAYGSIGNIDIQGSVTQDASSSSRFLAGYDIGSDLVFGNEDLSGTSTALQGGQSIGNVTVTGEFSGSDIAASINPGANYTFGDNISTASPNNNTNVGAGGSIGVVMLESSYQNINPFYSDAPADHGIEAATFAPYPDPAYAGAVEMTAALHMSTVPVVLYVDSTGLNDVRITDLSTPSADT